MFTGGLTAQESFQAYLTSFTTLFKLDTYALHRNSCSPGHSARGAVRRTSADPASPAPQADRARPRRRDRTTRTRGRTPRPDRPSRDEGRRFKAAVPRRARSGQLSIRMWRRRWARRGKPKSFGMTGVDRSRTAKTGMLIFSRNVARDQVGIRQRGAPLTARKSERVVRLRKVGPIQDMTTTRVRHQLRRRWLGTRRQTGSATIARASHRGWRPSAGRSRMR